MGPRQSDGAPSLRRGGGQDSVKDGSPRYHRRSSSDNITVEELSDDEYGYDGDIEVFRPDEYEEADSDTGNVASPPVLRQDYSYWQARLSEKLTALNCNSDTNESQDNMDRPPSRKRRSRESAKDAGHGRAARDMSASFEVVELVDGSGVGPPAKRRRRKSRRSKTSERIIHKLPTTQTDPRDVDKSAVTAMVTSASSTTTSSSLETPVEDAMEID
jgi:hypothetical protein